MHPYQHICGDDSLPPARLLTCSTFRRSRPAATPFAPAAAADNGDALRFGAPLVAGATLICGGALRTAVGALAGRTASEASRDSFEGVAAAMGLRGTADARRMTLTCGGGGCGLVTPMDCWLTSEGRRVVAREASLLPDGSTVAVWLLLLPLLGRRKDARSRWGPVLPRGGRFAATAFSSASSSVSQPMAAPHAVTDAALPSLTQRVRGSRCLPDVGMVICGSCPSRGELADRSHETHAGCCSLAQTAERPQFIGQVSILMGPAVKTCQLLVAMVTRADQRTATSLGADRTRCHCRADKPAGEGHWVAIGTARRACVITNAASA